jgi:hypothetical protein
MVNYLYSIKLILTALIKEEPMQRGKFHKPQGGVINDEDRNTVVQIANILVRSNRADYRNSVSFPKIKNDTYAHATSLGERLLHYRNLVDEDIDFLVAESHVPVLFLIFEKSPKGGRKSLVEILLAAIIKRLNQLNHKKEKSMGLSGEEKIVLDNLNSALAQFAKAFQISLPVERQYQYEGMDKTLVIPPDWDKFKQQVLVAAQ